MVATWRMRVKIHEATIVPTEKYWGRVVQENPLRRIRLDLDSSDRADIKANKVASSDGSRIERERGTSQGGVISPLLANLFLHYAFDTWMQRFCLAGPAAQRR
jgi:hypothetical protein